MQVLKRAVKEKIHDAALDLFYEKDFKSATMREIANRAEIPVGLIYTYYKNKEELFEDVVKPVLHYVTHGLAATSLIADKNEKRSKEQMLLLKLFHWRREMVLIIDKSAGSQYEGTKDRLISELEVHILKDVKQDYPDYDEMYAKLLAVCTMESILILARQYKDRQWLEKMVAFISDVLFLKAA